MKLYVPKKDRRLMGLMVVGLLTFAILIIAKALVNGVYAIPFSFVFFSPLFLSGHWRREWFQRYYEKAQEAKNQRLVVYLWPMKTR